MKLTEIDFEIIYYSGNSETLPMIKRKMARDNIFRGTQAVFNSLLRLEQYKLLTKEKEGRLNKIKLTPLGNRLRDLYIEIKWFTAWLYRF